MTPDYMLADEALLAACRLDTFRAQGPGGQHTNRTDSAVRLTHLISNVVVQCQDHRERRRNLQDALQRMRLRLALELRGVAHQDWIQPYRRGTRLTIGHNNAAYPCVVAIILDALENAQGALRTVADELQLSTSQITKLLTADKEVHAAVNVLRARFSLGPIHG